SVPAGTVAVPYSVTLAASGPTDNRTWSINNGALPPGLGIDAPTGTISGTPTTPGTFNFRVHVSRPGSTSDDQNLSILINPAQLQITTSSLPGATVGTAYSQPLATSGGTLPFTWSISSGNLPPTLGLSNGTISGNPTTPGPFNFTVQVKDSSSPQ